MIYFKTLGIYNYIESLVLLTLYCTTSKSVLLIYLAIKYYYIFYIYLFSYITSINFVESPERIKVSPRFKNRKHEFKKQREGFMRCLILARRTARTSDDS
jgi:hypothetical protein